MINSIVFTQAKEKFQAHALEGVLAILGTAIPAWLLLAESRVVPFVSQLDPTTVVRLLTLSLVVVVCDPAILSTAPKV